ncbi:MAG: hypothetical protein Q8S57_03260, partial [Methanoregula sp.]|nr:hypothetical protein [Methanoregula sp.]
MPSVPAIDDGSGTDPVPGPLIQRGRPHSTRPIQERASQPQQNPAGPVRRIHTCDQKIPRAAEL